jgi:hypothetical protein
LIRSPGFILPFLLAQRLAHSRFCFVKLRFGIPNRAAQQAGDLVMFVSFYLMQQENCPVARWQFFHGTSEHNPVDGGGKPLVDFAVFAFRRTRLPIGWFVE